MCLFYGMVWPVSADVARFGGPGEGHRERCQRESCGIQSGSSGGTGPGAPVPLNGEGKIYAIVDKWLVS